MKKVSKTYYNNTSVHVHYWSLLEFGDEKYCVRYLLTENNNIIMTSYLYLPQCNQYILGRNFFIFAIKSQVRILRTTFYLLKLASFF